MRLREIIIEHYTYVNHQHMFNVAATIDDHCGVFAFCAPFQILDDCPIDCGWKSIACRIGHATKRWHTKSAPQPSANPLATTFEVMKSRRHIVEMILERCMEEFEPSIRSCPLPNNCWYETLFDRHRQPKVVVAHPYGRRTPAIDYDSLPADWKIHVSMTDQVSPEFTSYLQGDDRRLAGALVSWALPCRIERYACNISSFRCL